MAVSFKGKLCCYLCVCAAVFRQGDVGTNWYTVLTGSLAVLTSDSTRPKVHQVGRSIISLLAVCCEHGANNGKTQEAVV